MCLGLSLFLSKEAYLSCHRTWISVFGSLSKREVLSLNPYFLCLCFDFSIAYSGSLMFSDLDTSSRSVFRMGNWFADFGAWCDLFVAALVIDDVCGANAFGARTFCIRVCGCLLGFQLFLDLTLVCFTNLCIVDWWGSLCSVIWNSFCSLIRQ